MGLLEIGWFVGFISCFPSIDGDWIWLLGLFLGFGKNMKNKLLCSYEKIMKSKKIIIIIKLDLRLFKKIYFILFLNFLTWPFKKFKC